MMENAGMMSLMKTRRSVRTFDGLGLTENELEKLRTLAADAGESNPFGIPVSFRLLSKKEHGVGSPVISGEEYYIAAKVEKVPHFEEAVGYSFEKLMLQAAAMGLGTVWIGGTMDRSLFEKAVDLGENERMPCVSPVGHPAGRMSPKEKVMRMGIRADTRLPFEKLFFDGSFERPLTKEAAGDLAEAFEAVRLAPSAVNKQPWRLVLDGSAVHFYESASRGMVSEAVGDMQRIDLGIAMCHFELALREKKIDGTFTEFGTDALPEAPSGAAYVISFEAEL